MSMSAFQCVPSYYNGGGGSYMNSGLATVTLGLAFQYSALISLDYTRAPRFNLAVVPLLVWIAAVPLGLTWQFCP